MIALVFTLGIVTALPAGVYIYLAGRGWIPALIAIVLISLLCILFWQIFLMLVFRVLKLV